MDSRQETKADSYAGPRLAEAEQGRFPSRQAPVKLAKHRASPLTTTRGGGGGALANRDSLSPDDPPLGFFATSFDTLSDADNYSFDSVLSPSGRNRSHFAAGNSIDIALPDLKHPDTDSYSLGDISPIKLIYNNGTTPGNTRRFEDSFMDHHHMIGEGPFKSHGHHHVSDVLSISNPFYVIRSARRAFDGCKFLLPCLRGDDVCAVNVSHHGHINHYRGHHDLGPVSLEFKVATRRVETAICAFGGSVNTASNREAQSIFRLKGEAKERQLYESCLPNRYYLSASGISWEVEENPPIHVRPEERPDSRPGDSRLMHGSPDSASQAKDNSSASCGSRDDVAKMKYRCKLCGQLKQNHECPYRQSLLRSIGVMVYPAVNSFTAAEPGNIAPALTQMNNFVSYGSNQGSPDPTYTSGGMSLVNPTRTQGTTITPASLPPGGLCFHSPQSSLSNHSDEGPLANNMTPPSNTMTGGSSGLDMPGHPMKKRPREIPVVATTPDAPIQQRAVFVAPVKLRPEHYRAVTPKGEEMSSTAFTYPSIPVTFPDRKRLSDTLFHLSKEIPTMTSECAMILREARKSNEWDLAVAELLTQVIVGLYCGEGDSCLDGLQQYLLTLGLSC